MRPLNQFQRIAYLLSLLLLVTYVLTGCATTAKSPMQTVYVAQESLVVYATWIVESHDAGSLTGDRYEKSKTIYKGARKALGDARAAAAAKDTDAFLVAMTAANTALAELALYKENKR